MYRRLLNRVVYRGTIFTSNRYRMYGARAHTRRVYNNTRACVRSGYDFTYSSLNVNHKYKARIGAWGIHTKIVRPSSPTLLPPPLRQTDKTAAAAAAVVPPGGSTRLTGTAASDVDKYAIHSCPPTSFLLPNGV